MTETTVVHGSATKFAQTGTLLTFIIQSTDDPSWTELSVGIHPAGATFSGTYGPQSVVYLSQSEFETLVPLIPRRGAVDVIIEHITGATPITKFQYKSAVFPMASLLLHKKITEIPASGDVYTEDTPAQAATGT